MEPIVVLNLGALGIFFACVMIYGIKLRTSMHDPKGTKRGFLNIYYTLWVKNIATFEYTTVAVQTMRNLIMSVTFLSSTILILLGFIIQSYSNITTELIDIPPFSLEAIPHYRLVILIVSLVFSLIMFLLSLRYMVRFSVLIGIPTENLEKTTAEKFGKKKEEECRIDAKGLQTSVFLKAMNRFTYGIRGLYYAVAVLLWFISAYIFIIGVIALTFTLIHFHDIKTPCPEETPI